MAARSLPWRRQRTPYTVWVAEIMLQQTQVAIVTPYFERWLQRFPTLSALAIAPLDDALKAWEGLGYYARARNLHRTAQIVMEQHDGELPRERAALLALPGIGRYTVGAILSLAWGQREPILDGNVRRVLCRVHDIAGDPRAPAVEAELWELSAALVQEAPAGRVGDLNEALMELGALVCTPSSPHCNTCPLNAVCLALQAGTVAERPLRTMKTPSPHFDTVAALVQDAEGRYLIVQRQMDGLLGGLWGFPGGTAAAGEAVEQAVTRTVREQTGVQVAPMERLHPIKHAYTHFKITLHPYHCRYVEGVAQPLTCAEVRWVRGEELERYAFAVTDRKIAAQLPAG